MFISPFGKYLISLIIDLNEIKFYPYIIIVLIIGFINIFNLMARNFFQASYRFKRVGISSIISFLISSLISITLIYYFDFGALGRFIGKLSSSVFLFLFLYLNYIKKHKT